MPTLGGQGGRWVPGRSRGLMLSRTAGQLPGSCCRPPRPTPSVCSTTAQDRWVPSGHFSMSASLSFEQVQMGHSALSDPAPSQAQHLP